MAKPRPVPPWWRLVVKNVQRPDRSLRVAYAWRLPRTASDMGRALRWWLDRLQSPQTRAALLSNHHQT